MAKFIYFVVFFTKGLQRQHLIGLAVAGFNYARTISKASDRGLDTRQEAYNKGMCSPGSIVNNPVRYGSLDAALPLKGQVVLDFSNVKKLQKLFNILQSA